MFDVENAQIRCKDLLLLSDRGLTPFWLPCLVRVAAAAANCSGSTIYLVIITKSDACASNTTTIQSNHPIESPGSSSTHSIDSYSLKLVAVSVGLAANASFSSSSVAAAQSGMQAVKVQLAQVQQQIVSLSHRRRMIPVTDAQEPRLKREIKAAKDRLSELEIAQQLLHRDCCAAVRGCNACTVIADAVLDSAAAISMDVTLTIPAASASPSSRDFHLSSVSWPDSARSSLEKQGVSTYHSHLAVAASADGSVAVFAQTNAVHIRFKFSRSASEGKQTIEFPNSVLALAVNPSGILIAAAVTSLTGSR